MRACPRFGQSAAAILAVALAAMCAGQAAPRLPGELAWTIGYDPKTFDPAKVDDQESELVRYLTAGVLLRFNRSQLLEMKQRFFVESSHAGKARLYKIW